MSEHDTPDSVSSIVPRETEQPGPTLPAPTIDGAGDDEQASILDEDNIFEAVDEREFTERQRRALDASGSSEQADGASELPPVDPVADREIGDTPADCDNPWEFPDCPECGASHVFVASSTKDKSTWHCTKCDAHFDT